MSERRPKVVTVAKDIAGRTPPHDLNAERAVLSVLLTEPERHPFDEVLPILENGNAFYTDAHRRIFDVALEVHRKGERVDMTTVGSLLNDRGTLPAIGGMKYLAQLVDATPAVAHVAAHARIVRAKFRVRTLIETCQMFAAEGYGDCGDVDEWSATINARFAELASASSTLEPVLLRDTVASYLDHLGAVHRGEREPCGIMSPALSRWTGLLGGFSLGQLHMVGGDTGGGKSSLAWQAALDVAGRTYRGFRVGVLVVNGEMSEDDLTERGFCIGSGLAISELNDRNMQRELVFGDRDPIDVGRDYLEPKPVALIARSATLDEIRALARKAQKKFDAVSRADRAQARAEGLPVPAPIVLMVVVVDYLTRMRLDFSGDRADLAVSKFTQGLKTLSMEWQSGVPGAPTGAHLMCLAQYNRQGKNSGSSAKNSSFVGSGDIENDADRITHIDRPVERMDDDDPAREALEDYARIRLGKGRSAKKGFIEMQLDGAHFRFLEPNTAVRERWREAQREKREQRRGGGRSRADNWD